MAKYIRKFSAHTQYESFVETSDFIYPNVSYCLDNENEVHYYGYPKPKVIATFNVLDNESYSMNHNTPISSPCLSNDCEPKMHTSDFFDKIEVDGVEVSMDELDTNYGEYELSLGEHTIEYTLKDPSIISGRTFIEISRMTSIVIPDSVTRICSRAFRDCQSLTTVTLGSGVATIDNNAFVFMTTNPLDSASIQSIEAFNQDAIYIESIK